MRNTPIITSVPKVKGRKTSRRLSGNGSSAPAASRMQEESKEKGMLLIGLDLGTNKSCIQSSFEGKKGLHRNELIPSIVGYASEGIVDGILPGNATMLFGEDAMKKRLHLKLVAPLVDGVVKDVKATRDFLLHLRSRIEDEGAAEYRVVAGLPANADEEAREDLRQAIQGIFDRVIFIPEPFLAALGCRDEARLGDSDYIDPVSNSLFVDIGAGTTDICMVQGYYPTAQDQVSIKTAGDRVDQLLADAIKRTYPDSDLSMIKIREIKEQFSYVGKPEGEIKTKVMVGGKPRTLELEDQVGEACETLMNEILDAVREVIARASSDSVMELLQNIILTGGGSRVRNLASEMQRILEEDGFESPRVLVAGEHDLEFVARGALKAARGARENQWQRLIK